LVISVLLNWPNNVVVKLRNVAEEKRRQEAEQRRIDEEERKAAEEARLAAEEAQRKRESSFIYKVGKKLSGVKKAVTAPCKNKKAVDENATGDAEEQYPNYEY
jgi:membrane protein involved in colicin uptake